MRWLLPFLALLLTGCPHECELAALAVGYMHGLVFGAAGLFVIHLVIALWRPKEHGFLVPFLVPLGFGILGLGIGFMMSRSFPCEDLWLHRLTPWVLGLIASSTAFFVVHKGREPSDRGPHL